MGVGEMDRKFGPLFGGGRRRRRRKRDFYNKKPRGATMCC
jgi:hypothetical protein